MSHSPTRRAGTFLIGGTEAHTTRSIPALTLPIIAVGAALALIPLWLGDSRVLMGVAVLGLAFACYAIGFNIIFGSTGQLFLCVGALAGVGGFCVSNHDALKLLHFASRPYTFTASGSPANVAAVAAALPAKFASALPPLLWKTSRAWKDCRRAWCILIRVTATCWKMRPAGCT